MAWKIRILPRAIRSLEKLDRPVARMIYRRLREIEALEDPRSRGKALTGNLAGFWRYRIGDYRAICDIIDEEVVVLVINVVHRSRAYRP